MSEPKFELCEVVRIFSKDENFKEIDGRKAFIHKVIQAENCTWSYLVAIDGHESMILPEKHIECLRDYFKRKHAEKVTNITDHKKEG